MRKVAHRWILKVESLGALAMVLYGASARSLALRPSALTSSMPERKCTPTSCYLFRQDM